MSDHPCPRPLRAPRRAHDPIRVMVVDDAVVVRGMIARWIEAEPDLHIVASLRSGREAIEQVERVAARCGHPRRRHARHRRHHGAAALAGEEARSRRADGFDADPPQCRDQPARAVARRDRLHPEAANQPRVHHLARRSAASWSTRSARSVRRRRRRPSARVSAPIVPLGPAAATARIVRRIEQAPQPRPDDAAAGEAQAASCGRFRRRWRRACC